MADSIRMVRAQGRSRGDREAEGRKPERSKRTRIKVRNRQSLCNLPPGQYTAPYCPAGTPSNIRKLIGPDCAQAVHNLKA